jgi:predicted O-methyltransferase YrrM
MNLKNAIQHPRYVVDRINTLWFEHSTPDAPWLTREAVNILSTWLRNSDRGLEFGSGRSTVWFSKRVGHIVSVESDPAWFSKVQEMLRGVSNVDLRHFADEASYAAVTKDFAPQSFDFVLVDGIARAACAHGAIPLLKSGGILVLDNANWFLPSDTRSPQSRRPGDNTTLDAASWDDFLVRVASWRHIWTSSGVTDTALWIRP